MVGCTDMPGPGHVSQSSMTPAAQYCSRHPCKATHNLIYLGLVIGVLVKVKVDRRVRQYCAGDEQRREAERDGEHLVAVVVLS